MRDLVKEAGLEPIKFEFSSFTMVIFPRKPLTAEKFISEDKNFGINFGIHFGVKGKKRDNMLNLLSSIDREKGVFDYVFCKKRGHYIKNDSKLYKIFKR